MTNALAAVQPARAGAGQGHVMVRPRLRVAILSSGLDLAEPEVSLAQGWIWNANRAQLAAALSLP
jgi:molybdopterin molybdotransferase